MEEKQTFQWIPEVEALHTTPILAYPKLRERLITWYASNVRFGGVLFQVKDGQERVIVYHSKTLNKDRRNHFVTDRNYLQLRGHWNISLSTSMDKSSTSVQITLHWCDSWAFRTLRDKQPAGLSTCRSTTSLASIKNAENNHADALLQWPFLKDYSRSQSQGMGRHQAGTSYCICSRSHQGPQSL